MSLEYKPYTYLIGWSKLNKWYYGCEYSNNVNKIANPNNLWNVYFTSSNKVKEFRKKYGEPDVIQVRKIFDSAEKTYLWEQRVLERIGITDDKWLNVSTGGKVYTCQKGIKFSKSHRRKISENNVGFRGRHHTKQSKRKIALKLIGVPRSYEVKKKISKTKQGQNPWIKFKHPRQGISLSPELKKKISISVKKSVVPTIWITNGVASKRLPIEESIPEGYRRGRK